MKKTLKEEMEKYEGYPFGDDDVFYHKDILEFIEEKIIETRANEKNRVKRAISRIVEVPGGLGKFIRDIKKMMVEIVEEA